MKLDELERMRMRSISWTLWTSYSLNKACDLRPGQAKHASALDEMEQHEHALDELKHLLFKACNGPTRTSENAHAVDK